MSSDLIAQFQKDVDVAGALAASSSPGFTWGRSGLAIPSGTFLLNDTVPSSATGRTVPLTGNITRVFVANGASNTFTVDILKRTGPGTFSSLTTIALVAQRVKSVSALLVAVAADDEIAVKILSGTCDNVVVGVIIQ